MTAAWYGGLEGASEYAKDERLRTAISLAVDYWFKRDFTNRACLDSGGKPGCPCDNPDNLLWYVRHICLWNAPHLIKLNRNTNWYSNVSAFHQVHKILIDLPLQVILIPGMVGKTCLMLRDTLSSFQLSVCTRMTTRSYEYNVNGLTGANTLDVCRIGMDQALLTSNEDLLTDAYRRSYRELRIMDQVKADGIRADGAFGQLLIFCHSMFGAHKVFRSTRWYTLQWKLR